MELVGPMHMNETKSHLSKRTRKKTYWTTKRLKKEFNRDMETERARKQSHKKIDLKLRTERDRKHLQTNELR